jgi:hypothetical protein
MSVQLGICMSYKAVAPQPIVEKCYQVLAENSKPIPRSQRCSSTAGTARFNRVGYARVLSRNVLIVITDLLLFPECISL